MSDLLGFLIDEEVVIDPRTIDCHLLNQASVRQLVERCVADGDVVVWIFHRDVDESFSLQLGGMNEDTITTFWLDLVVWESPLHGFWKILLSRSRRIGR